MRAELYDATTDLPTVELFTDRLRVDLARAMRTAEGLAVVAISIETPSRATEGAVLVAASALVRAFVRADETAAFVGANELGLILTGLVSAEQVVTRTQSLLAALQRADLGGATMSIGVAIFPRDIATSDDLWSAARLAAKSAVAEGGNVLRFYSPEMDRKSALRRHIESRLKGALARNELGLEYQLMFSLGSGMISGAEALLRWTDTERGSIAPDQFIPIAEESDVILGLGAWVLRRACSMVKERSRLKHPDVPVSVNMSARQFEEQDVHELVKSALDESQISPALLQLEVTEGLIAREGAKALHMLQAIREMGVKIALDDFGTGMIRMRDLKSLPVDYIKIDPCFIRSMREDHRDQAVVECIVRLANRMGYRVVAEGVENDWEASCLRELGCHEAQGYFFHQPMPENEFALLMPSPPSRRTTPGVPLRVSSTSILKQAG